MKYIFFYGIIFIFSFCFTACGNKAENDRHEEEDQEHLGIVFTKEQAKYILDFRVEEIRPQTFYEILKTSGQILSAPGDEQLISATMSGIVRITNPNMVEGLAVNTSQVLFSISSESLSDNNVSSRLSEAQTLYNIAQAEYERANLLSQDKIISDKEFIQIKANYDNAKLNLQTLSIGMSGNDKQVKSKIHGFVKNILVQTGQYVEIGQPLATITKNKKLILRADVSQRYLPLIKHVKTATFVTPYDNKTHVLSDLNGHLLSFGKNSDDSFYTPINFEFDNTGTIIEGAFVIVYLKSQPIENTIVLPIAALIEEQDHFFVFVQDEEHDDEYVKQEVKIGASDGSNRQILDGLKFGQKVVTNGAYAVKLASLSNAVPEHAH